MMKTFVLKVMVGLMSAGLTAGGTADIRSLNESVKFETIVAKTYENNLVQASEVLKGDAKTAEVKQASGSEKQAVVEAKAAEKAAAEKAVTEKAAIEKAEAQRLATEKAAREQAERETTEISAAAQVEAKPVTLPAEDRIIVASGSCSGSFNFSGEQKTAAEQVTTDYGCAYCGYYAPDMDSLYKHFDDAHPQAEQSTEPQETVQVFGCSCEHHDSDYDAFMYHMAQHVLNGEVHNYNWWYEYPNGEICYDKVL